jgi:hypothetical protein
LDRIGYTLYPISSTNDIVLAVYENIGYDGLALDCLEVTKIQIYLAWIEFFFDQFQLYDSGYGYGT